MFVHEHVGAQPVCRPEVFLQTGSLTGPAALQPDWLGPGSQDLPISACPPRLKVAAPLWGLGLSCLPSKRFTY